MKHAYLILLLVLLQACAAPVPRTTTTVSGSPEVIITKFSVKQLHDIVINGSLEIGSRIVSDHDINVVISREMGVSRAAGKQFAASFASGEKGNIYSEEISYYFSDTPNGVRVIARLYTVTQSRTGQTARHEEIDNETYNSMQDELNRMKSELESIR